MFRTRWIARAAMLAGLAMLMLHPATNPALAADDPKARAIMEKVNARDDGKTQVSDLEMTLIDKNGSQRVRALRSLRLEAGDQTKSIMFFLSPADVKGTGFLTYDYAQSGKDDDQWLFLPALRKTKRIAAGDKSGSFMGSDFNYSDMVEPDLEDFDYKLIKETEVDGQAVWQIEATPRSKEIAEETGYDKGMAWIRKDNLMMVRAVRWVHKSNRRKYFQLKGLKQIEGVWVATEMQMVSREGKKTMHATVLKFSEISINKPLDEEQFTIRSLERGL